MFTRYHWAAGFVSGKRVLELGCGSGPGLGYFRKHGAIQVVGSDIEDRNLEHARKHYANRAGIQFHVIDAQTIPFPDASFDVVLMFEAIYYVHDAKRFLAEAFRVLPVGGVLLISTVNRGWPQFNPSPFSVWYPSARELYEALVAAGFSVVMKGGFPDQPASLARNLVRQVRRLAVKLRLIPDTMKGKELLKRIFYGKLETIPHELEENRFDREPLTLTDPMVPNSIHTFLYAEATRLER